MYNERFTQKWKIAKQQLRRLNPKWNGRFEILKSVKTKKIIGLDLTNRIEAKQNGKRSIITLPAELSDLSPIKNLPLKKLNIRASRIENLVFLVGMPLEYLDCSFTSVKDLDPLKNLPLVNLYLSCTKVKDISPLKNLKLKELVIDRTLVNDLTPLIGQKIILLDISHTPCSDKQTKLDVKYLINRK